ncbi:fibroblast growth factor 23-like [Gouania willdenowi]|uniref:fibroblast growth factor 23-like n=1 Tax=Gouania willdenowi TaxID=441366 RepID=UPI0010561218|nr:fibroblast growth factor 23-like [Gouania willdenowi]
MQPAPFLLILIAVHLPVSCRPRLQVAERPVLQQSSRNTGSPLRRLFIWVEKKHHHGNSLIVLPVRTATNYVVSIFDLKRKRFLCMDSMGEPYNSRKMEQRDCLFQHNWSANHQNVFTLLSGGRLLQLERVKNQAAQREPPEPSSALLERLLIPLMKRQKRSDQVDPSDPLRTESHPTKDLKDVEQSLPEQDQAGAVSKETITSCHDPLRVLQPNAPISPVKNNIADQASEVSKETITSLDEPLLVLQLNAPISPAEDNTADQAKQE